MNTPSYIGQLCFSCLGGQGSRVALCQTVLHIERSICDWHVFFLNLNKCKFRIAIDLGSLYNLCCVWYGACVYFK